LQYYNYYDYYDYDYDYDYPLTKYVKPNSNIDSSNNNNNSNNVNNNNNSDNGNTVNTNNNNNNNNSNNDNNNKDTEDKEAESNPKTICTCDLDYSDSYQMFHAKEFQDTFKQLLHGKYAKIYEYLDSIGFHGVIMANDADKAVIISTKPFHIYNINKILIISNTDLQLKYNAFNIDFNCPYTQYTGILIFSMNKMTVIHKYRKTENKPALIDAYNRWYKNYINRWLL
jgi:hypothetical protein